MNKEPLDYTAEHFFRDVGELSDSEIAWLADSYPTYRIKNWRLTLLQGIKAGKPNWQILADKIRDKKIDVNSDQSEGGHTRMIPFKIRRAAIRLLYLRYIENGKTRRQANALTGKLFPDLSQNAIARNTRKP